MLVLAHISDLHLDGSDRATRRAERVRDLLWGLPGRVDALLVTGDIADHGTEAEYEEAARLLGLRDGGVPFPVLTCPGNHDSRAPYRKALLGEEPADGPVNTVHVFAEAAVLMCDSSVPGRDEGELESRTYAWIEETLDGLDGDRPALLAFHHPPVALHHPPAGRLPAGPAREARPAAGAPAGDRGDHHRPRPHTRRDPVRRAPAGRRPGGDVDAAAPVGGRPGRGPGGAARTGVPCAGRRGAADQPLPGGRVGGSDRGRSRGLR